MLYAEREQIALLRIIALCSKTLREAELPPPHLKVNKALFAIVIEHLLVTLNEYSSYKQQQPKSTHLKSRDRLIKVKGGKQAIHQDRQLLQRYPIPWPDTASSLIMNLRFAF